MRIDESWYRRPAGVPDRSSAGGGVVRVAEGRVLLALVREGVLPDCVLPKGGVEPGESDEAAARREIGEEAGLHQLVLLADLGFRERLDYERIWWITTHYFLFRTEQAEGIPTDTEHPHRMEWHPLDALPPFFWPEQAELVATHQEVICRLALEKGE